MYLLLINFLFIGSCSAGLFGRKLGPEGFSTITTDCFSSAVLVFLFFLFKELFDLLWVVSVSWSVSLSQLNLLGFWSMIDFIIELGVEFI
jgi:NADH:ubiquinone oxidoreductase subunit 3 (subunit A)